MKRLTPLRLITAGAALTTILFIAGCGDDDDGPTNPPIDPPFSLSLTIEDSVGNPVPDLRISSWNHITMTPVGAPKRTASGTASPAATTTIQFTLLATSSVNLSIYDLNGELVEMLVDDTLFAGLYNAGFHIAEPIPSQVFKIDLQSTEVGSENTLTEAIYAYLLQPDPEVSVLGFTDTSGIYESMDSLPFPNTFHLLELPRMNEIGELIDSYLILDSVHFVLTDTLTDSSMVFDARITNGLNVLSVIWNPESGAPLPEYDYSNGQAAGPSVITGPLNLSSETELIVYPNPFN